MGKMVFSDNDGVQEVICWAAGRNNPEMDIKVETPFSKNN